MNARHCNVQVRRINFNREVLDLAEAKWIDYEQKNEGEPRTAKLEVNKSRIGQQPRVYSNNSQPLTPDSKTRYMDANRR